MSFPRYSKSANSGVEWLGSLPEHWKVVPLCCVAKERDESNAAMLEKNLLSLSYGQIVRKNINTNDGLLPESFETYQVVHSGDIIFRLTDLQNDKRSLRTAIARETGIITSAYIAAVPVGISPSYFHYLLRSYDLQKVFYAMGGGLRQSMKFADLRRIPIALPTPDEQAAIVTFLELETAKIASLIAEQKRLVELLTEKRQLIISRAVTRGLNLDAPIKDSNVTWIGAVPAHWTVGPLKWAFDAVDYGISESLEPEGSVAILRMGNIGPGGKIVLDDLKYVDSIDEQLLLKRDDLLYNRTNSLDLIGKVGLYDGKSEGRVSFASYLVRLRTRSSCVPKFFAYMLNTPGMLGEARANAIVAIGQCNLNPTRYGALIVAIPPRSEQEEIARHLDEITQKIDALIAEAETAVALLEERRTALIPAAVTGKIDVRGLMSSHAEAEVAA